MVSSKQSLPFGSAADPQNPWPEHEKTPCYAPGQLHALASEPPQPGGLQPPAAAHRTAQATPTGIRLSARGAAARAAAQGRNGGTLRTPPIPEAARLIRSSAPAPAPGAHTRDPHARVRTSETRALSPGLAPTARASGAGVSSTSSRARVQPRTAAGIDPLGLELSALRRDPRSWMGNTERALALVAILGGVTLLALLFFGGFLG